MPRVWIDEKPLTTFAQVLDILPLIKEHPQRRSQLTRSTRLSLWRNVTCATSAANTQSRILDSAKATRKPPNYAAECSKQLDEIARTGVAIVIVAHSKIVTFNNPEGENFDRYEFKLHKKTGKRCSNGLITCYLHIAKLR